MYFLSSAKFSSYFAGLYLVSSYFFLYQGQCHLPILALVFRVHILLVIAVIIRCLLKYNHQQMKELHTPYSRSHRLTLYHKIHTFKDSWLKNPLKTLWEKKKLLVTSISSFSHNVFNPIKDKNHHFKYFNFVICKCFQFGPF